MKKLLTLTAIIGLLALGFYFYFHNVGRLRPTVNEIFITSPEIPASFNGARIVVISDVFVRNETSLTLLENTIYQINILNPEIIVFSGNLFAPTGLPFQDQVTELLKNLETNLVKIAVFGYHDLIHQDITRQVLTSAGFRVLVNESMHVFNQSPIGLNVIGSSPINNRETMEHLLDVHSANNRFNLLLMSVPTYSTTSLNHNINLQISGHCLGIKDSINTTSPCFQFYNGAYHFANTFTLHVSSGLARFHHFENFIRPPRIDSFLLHSE